jgi:glycosyltransferase involved in cell wall biosynthesis
MKELIFICGNLYPHQVGGLEVYNHYLLNELQTKLKISVLSHQRKPKQLIVENFIRFSTIKPHGIFFSFWIFFYLLFRRTNNVIVLLSFAKSHWINWVPYPILGKIKNLKYSIIVHSSDNSAWGLQPVYWNLFKYSDRILGVSESICKEYTSKSGREVVYLAPLIPFKKSSLSKKECKEKLGIDLDSKVILLVGSLKPLKNPETVLEALNFLGLDFIKRNKIHVVFIGDGILRKKLEDIVSKFNLNTFVTFKGQLPREEIPNYYGASDLYLISSDFEGKSLALLEALNYPLEIIGSDADGIVEVLNDFEGNIFERGNFKALSLQLKIVIEDPHYKPKFIMANEVFHSKYSYETYISNFLNILNCKDLQSQKK